MAALGVWWCKGKMQCVPRTANLVLMILKGKELAGFCLKALTQGNLPRRARCDVCSRNRSCAVDCAGFLFLTLSWSMLSSATAGMLGAKPCGMPTYNLFRRLQCGAKHSKFNTNCV